MAENAPLRGLRREMDKQLFEELAALQCEIPEILGYVGTTEEKLSKWCRRNYRMPLEETMFMLRQDGLIEIRRASFDQLRKSATLIQQQITRFLSGKNAGQEEEAKKLAERIFSLEESEEEVRGLFKEDGI